jgi:tripartite-type tricarboxylate transporter receptor subunit TctC
MKVFFKAIVAGMLALLAATPCASASDNYPNKPITFIVPYSSGSNSDITSRLLAKQLTDRLGQPVIVDNKPGAGGILGMEIGALAKPDGYTLIFSSNSQMASYPYLYKKLSYDPAKQFIAVRTGSLNPYVLFFNPARPYKTLDEFIDYAKKNPDKINYGSVGPGSPAHLAGELFQQLTGIKMMHVPYRLSPSLYADLLSGVLDIGFEFASAMKGYVEEGKLIPIAVAHDARLKTFAKVPTFAELGYPDMKISAWGAYLVPAGTAESIVAKLDSAFAEAIKSRPLQEYYAIGDSQPLDIGHRDFPAFLIREQAKMKTLVEVSGATAD